MNFLKKRWAIVAILILLVGLFPIMVFAAETPAKEKFESGYDFFVKALRQFPYPYKLVGDQQLGTLQGSNGINVLEKADAKYYKERYGDDVSSLRYIELRTVTREDRLVTVKLVGSEIDLKIFLHELSPDTGKYKFWNPVILFPVYGDKKIPPVDNYWICEIDIVGRFFIKWDARGKDPNKILGYENEMYHR
jgi:hypothetical protein